MTDQTIPLTFTTEDGVTLSGERLPSAQPRAVAVVCHPHPLYGGNMYNHVVASLHRAFASFGLDSLRFDFRGVGRSEGSHGGGESERLDVASAIELQATAHPATPVILAGYSFGADVILSVADRRLAGWLAVAPPLRVFPTDGPAAADDPRPTCIISGTSDEFRSAADADAVVSSWDNTTVTALEGADHFLTSGVDRSVIERSIELLLDADAV